MNKSDLKQLIREAIAEVYKRPSPYTDTLGQALEGIRMELEAFRAVVDPENADWMDTFSMGGLSYGTDKSVNIKLVSLKGKPTRKYAHATIWRGDTGRYEWNLYFL
jgi:hypothetical protein